MTRHPDNIGPNMVDILRRLSASGRPWTKPADIGGSTRSHHSGTLIKLAARGLVRYRCGKPEPPPGENGQGRGKRTYQITPAGRAVLERMTCTT